MATAASLSAFPVVVTVPEKLNDAARDRIQKFLAEAAPMLPRSPAYAAMAQSEPEIFAQKWLLARMWVIADAVAMLSAAIQYRCDRRLDTSPNFPSAFPVRGYDQSALAAFQGLGERGQGVLDVQCKNISRCLCQVTHATCVHVYDLTLSRCGTSGTRAVVRYR
jgi:hypothetical protein